MANGLSSVHLLEAGSHLIQGDFSLAKVQDAQHLYAGAQSFFNSLKHMRTDQSDKTAASRSGDLSVKVRAGWKALARVRRPTSSTHQDELQDTRQIIDACADDIITLWEDETVQAGLRERKIALEDHYV